MKVTDIAATISLKPEQQIALINVMNAAQTLVDSITAFMATLGEPESVKA